MDPALFTMFNPADENGFIQLIPSQLDTNDLNYKIGKFEVEYARLLENTEEILYGIKLDSSGFFNHGIE